MFEELFADDFVDHTPQPGTTPNKDGVRVLYKRLRAAFPDFRPEIHWQAAAGNLVTTYKTYHGTHQPQGRMSVSTPGRRDAARSNAAARCRPCSVRSAMTTLIAERVA